MPAADACTAPQIPRARPICPVPAMPIAAVSVQCANRPAPRPIKKTPPPNSKVDCIGAANSSAENANRPASAPVLARRYASMPRPSSLAAMPKPISPPTASSAVNAVVTPTGRCRTWPPYGSSRMSCMLNAVVPKPRATRRRRAVPWRSNSAQAARKLGRARSCAVSDGRRGSCFHSATAFSTMVATEAPWITWISRISEKCANTKPNSNALKIMPSSSIMQSRATTFGCLSGGERSVASARPTVCVVCSPAPTSRKASAAATWPMKTGPLLSPERMISANGMIARPPNCSMVPNQR